MNPISNKKNLSKLVEDLREMAYSYLEKYSPTKQQLNSLSLEVDKVNNSISEIKNSVSWNWYFTKGDSKKQLMDNYIKSILNK